MPTASHPVQRAANQEIAVTQNQTDISSNTGSQSKPKGLRMALLYFNLSPGGIICSYLRHRARAAALY
jgi:hypothetical protein